MFVIHSGSWGLLDEVTFIYFFYIIFFSTKQNDSMCLVDRVGVILPVIRNRL